MITVPGYFEGCQGWLRFGCGSCRRTALTSDAGPATSHPHRLREAAPGDEGLPTGVTRILLAPARRNPHANLRWVKIGDRGLSANGPAVLALRSEASKSRCAPPRGKGRVLARPGWVGEKRRLVRRHPHANLDWMKDQTGNDPVATLLRRLNRKNTVSILKINELHAVSAFGAMAIAGVITKHRFLMGGKLI